MTAPEKQMRLVIVGATGMVGGYALGYALEQPAVGRVTVIGRRTLDISHPKLTEVLHRDFGDCTALAEALSGQDAAVFCLGTYTGSVSDAELRTITAGYTIEFARVLRSSSPTAAFSFLSGSGADPTGRSSHDTRERQRTPSTPPVFPRVYLQTRVYLFCAATQRTEFELPPVARDIPGFSGAFPQSSHSGRRLGPGNGRRRRPRCARIVKRCF